MVDERTREQAVTPVSTVTPVSLDYIVVDARGVAYIAGTTMKVSQIAVEATAWGMTPKHIQGGHANLSLEQVYAALAYYYANKTQVDAQLDADEREADAILSQQPPGVTRQVLEDRLRQRGEAVPTR